MAFFFTDSSGEENRGHVQQLILPGTAAPGRIVAMTSPASARNRAGRRDQSIPFLEFPVIKALITDVTIAEQTNHQFMHTLGRDIYLYSFGDRIGQMSVGGIAVYDNCTGLGQAGPRQPMGISQVLDYFRATKLTEREEPMAVTIAPATVLRGFLYRFRGRVMDPAQRLFQWHLDMALIPERNL